MKRGFSAIAHANDFVNFLFFFLQLLPPYSLVSFSGMHHTIVPHGNSQRSVRTHERFQRLCNCNLMHNLARTKLKQFSVNHTPSPTNISWQIWFVRVVFYIYGTRAFTQLIYLYNSGEKNEEIFDENCLATDVFFCFNFFLRQVKNWWRKRENKWWANAAYWLHQTLKILLMLTKFVSFSFLLVLCESMIYSDFPFTLISNQQSSIARVELKHKGCYRVTTVWREEKKMLNEMCFDRKKLTLFTMHKLPHSLILKFIVAVGWRQRNETKSNRRMKPKRKEKLKRTRWWHRRIPNRQLVRLSNSTFCTCVCVSFFLCDSFNGEFNNKRHSVAWQIFRFLTFRSHDWITFSKCKNL